MVWWQKLVWRKLSRKNVPPLVDDTPCKDIGKTILGIIPSEWAPLSDYWLKLGSQFKLAGINWKTEEQLMMIFLEMDYLNLISLREGRPSSCFIMIRRIHE